MKFAAVLVTFALLAAPVAAGSSNAARALAYDDRSANVQVYDTMLTRLRPKCSESRDKVAAMVLKGKRILRGDGYRATNLMLLRAVNKALPAGFGRQPCRDIIATLIVMIENG